MIETINQRVAHQRKLSGLTQQETAEKLGMKCSTYSQMERKGNISAKRLLDLAAIFGISSELLLHGEEQPKNFLKEPPVLPPPPPPPPEPQPVLTKKEENILKVFRNSSKEDKNEIINFVNEIYQKQCKKK